jgi:hypothetical protein
MRILKPRHTPPERPSLVKGARTTGDLAQIADWLRAAREPAHQVQGVQSNWREFLAQRRAVLGGVA